MSQITVALDILSRLDKEGYAAYIVGGYVRDFLRGCIGDDIDIATSATPQEVIDIFPHIVPTGMKHGTVTVLQDGHAFEVTTYRKDVSCDGKNATVEFSDFIEDDLARRDFTMNAVAYNPHYGDKRWVDPYRGARDIFNGVIRAVGRPQTRYREDYARLIRLARFSAQFSDMTIEEVTYLDFLNVAGEGEWHKHISVERITAEFDKCFKRADNPSGMIQMLYGAGILDKILPEVSNCVGFSQNKHHLYCVFDHTMNTLDAVPKSYPLIRWAALFHDIGKLDAKKGDGPDCTFHGHEEYSAEKARGIMRRLKFSNQERRTILALVKHHMRVTTDNMKDSTIRRLVVSLGGPEMIEPLCILKRADREGNGKKAISHDYENKLVLRVEDILAYDSVFRISDLKITGTDIMEMLSVKQGPFIGEVLKYLFDLVIDEDEPNEAENLKRLALAYSKGE